MKSIKMCCPSVTVFVKYAFFTNSTTMRSRASMKVLVMNPECRQAATSLGHSTRQSATHVDPPVRGISPPEHRDERAQFPSDGSQVGAAHREQVTVVDKQSAVTYRERREAAGERPAENGAYSRRCGAQEDREHLETQRVGREADGGAARHHAGTGSPLGDCSTSPLQKHARTKWKQRCRAIVVRFRGAFAYVDAFPLEPWYSPGATPEQRAVIDATPMRLCRLGYLGSLHRWEYAFFRYSDERYAASVVASGSFEATPEEAFDCSAAVYLHS